MGFSDIVHGVLDVAGFIPVVGVAADVANAAVYAAEGDWANAALSAVSAIPVVGDTAAVAGKSVKVISKISKGSEKAFSKSKKMKSLFTAMKGKAKTGAKKILNKINRKRKARKQKRAAKKVFTHGKCFTGDMLVCTKQGLCPIKEIRKGDDIYSRNMQTGEIGIRKVEEIFQTEAHTIHHIWLDGKEELKTTAYHPVFVKERGWVSAINLREGDLLETLEGTAQVTKTEKVRHEEPVEVFNFHVEEWESYFVSGRQVYVHNGGGHKHGRSSIPNSSQGYSPHGYNPKPGERTFEGYVENNVPKDAETKLYTSSRNFNTNPKNDGHFKRFGTKPDQHGIHGPHVHQPTRNVNPHTGMVTGKPGTNTHKGGVTSPGRKDVKQLYQYLNNGKYHKR